MVGIKSIEGEIMENADKVVKALEERGFILELNVFRKLKSMKWNTQLSSPFWNVELDLKNESLGVGKNVYQKNQEKMRSMDILASRTTEIGDREIGTLMASLCYTSLVVECKKRSSENWVFYQETPFFKGNRKLDHYSLGGMFMVDYLSRIGKIGGNEEKYNDILRTSHHCLAEVDKIATAGVPVFGPKTKNGLYGSCEQVISAFEYEVSRYQGYTNRALINPAPVNLNWRVYPIIVFDGPLWEVVLENDQISVKPRKRVIYEHTRGELKHLIDIVSWESFDEYCDILEEEITRLSKL